ncbi:TLC domain-containing protein [Xylaria palmicola]|nr:TLC domain-containing protein [Xylaria palmicola]
METRNVVDSSVDLLQSPISSKHIRLRHHSLPGDKDAITRDTGRTTHSRLPAKRRKPPNHGIRRQRASWTWKIPLLVIATLLLFYALDPSESNIISPFISLSYRVQQGPNDPSPPQYGKGPRDIAFVAFYTLVLFAARELVTRELLRPLAASYGMTSRRRQAQFAEQAYVALYTGVVGPLGAHVMYRSPTWYFSTAGMYAGYPHATHAAPAKAYYLVQAAFWAQQALAMALGLEARRRDFRELVAHHVVTVALIGLSYRFHFTMMGVLVYVTHDISDFFLATSKVLNYLESPLQGPYYALCIAVWIYLRHYINLGILRSILTEFRTVGPYGLDWEAGQYKCAASGVITFALLAALQALNLFWLWCLLRNGYRFIAMGVAGDDREEDEEVSRSG